MTNVSSSHAFSTLSPKAMAHALMQPSAANFDMIASCRLCMKEFGISDQQLAVYDNDPSLNQAKNCSEYIQRTALNQFWHLQMGPFGGKSHSVRFKLIDTGTPEDWFKHFVQGPVQFIVDNNLPVQQ